MVELSNERIEQMLHEENVKQEEMTTILRGIYVRYMRLYEKYFTDIDTLNDDKIAEFRKYHDETRSLIKYYYLDIPLDTCTLLNEFEDEYCAKLLGDNWHDHLIGAYKEFKKNNAKKDKKEDDLKAEFEDQSLTDFYDAMDYVFRYNFGTESKTSESVLSGFTGLLFGKE